MGITEKKIDCNNQNKCILLLPKGELQALGWLELNSKKDSIPVEIISNPFEDIITIKRKEGKPIGLIMYCLRMRHLQYKKSPKVYTKDIVENLSPEGRHILYTTDWDNLTKNDLKGARERLDKLREQGFANEDDAIKEAKKLIQYYEKELEREMKKTLIKENKKKAKHAKLNKAGGRKRISQ